MKNQPYRAAIIPFQGLGDILVYSVLAQNLSNIGMSVDLYSSQFLTLGPWFPDIQIKPFDAQEPPTEKNLQQYDLIIADPVTAHDKLKNSIECNPELLKRTIWNSATPMSNLDYQHPTTAPCLEPLLSRTSINASIPLIDKSLGNLSVVEFTQYYCKHYLHIAKPTDRPAISPPPEYVFKKESHRVLIFPTTNREAKDYTTRGFLAIAKGLQARGLHPEIIVSPNEKTTLGKIFSPNGHRVKSFKTLEQLARHIYESGAVISNDSGGGHFASLLNIPCVIIHKKYNDFEWRPGWKKPLIARPKVRLKLLGKRIWKPFISHAEIINYIVSNTN